MNLKDFGICRKLKFMKGKISGKRMAENLRNERLKDRNRP